MSIFSGSFFIILLVIFLITGVFTLLGAVLHITFGVVGAVMKVIFYIIISPLLIVFAVPYLIYRLLRRA